MSFTSITLIAAYFLSALGLASVSLVDGIGPWFVAMTAFAALWSLYFNVKKKTLISSGLWNVLAVIVFLLFIADFLLISRTLILSASRFLTVLLVLKLFDLKTGRDHFIASGIVFFLILAAAASTVSPAFFVVLTLFIAASIFVMMIFTMKKDWEAGRKAGTKGAQPLEDDVPRGIFDARFFVWTAVVSVSCLAGALLLFFILPRMGAGFFEKKTLNTVKVTGFSDRVDLGSIGPVKNDGTIVMRVELQQKSRAQGSFYFRGAALDFYDGKIWSRELRGNRILARTMIELVSHFSLERGRPISASTGEIVEQNILLEPLETEILFAASHPLEIAGKFSNLSIDDGRAVYLPSTPYSRVEYKAWSVPGPLAALRPEDAKYTDTSYLTSEAARARLAALTAEVTKGQITDFDKARAIEDYLRRNFAYTLNPKKGGDPLKEAEMDPVDNFLFFAKEGYCAHFAASMAVMLRLSGVPSRIVTGFSQGEWNSLGGYFIVRQMDAHSWVEAYAEQNNVGAWHTFDPTPSQGIQPPHLPSEFMQYLDFIRWKWNRYIINFSFSDQKKLAHTLESRTAGIMAWLKNALREKPKINAKGAWLVLAALLLAAACYLYMKKALAKRLHKPKTPRFYLDLLGILEKKGYVKKAFETPMEFAARIEPFQRVGSSRVAEITELFQKERYGGRAVDRAETEKVEWALEELKKGLAPALPRTGEDKKR